MTTRQQPTRAQLVTQLKNLTRALEANGAQAERMAPLLAARGWPTSTLGDGGSRSTSEHTSTERAGSHRDRWADADQKLARFYLQTYTLVTAGQQLIADLAGHAIADEDHEHEGRATTPNGGWCLACDRWVTGAADDRLRSGFCNACRVAFGRLAAKDPHADRAAFIRTRPKHDQAPEPVHIDPTTSTLQLDVDRATHATTQPVEVTRWSHGQTTDLTDPAA